jgi:hypothetical protein
MDGGAGSCFPVIDRRTPVGKLRDSQALPAERAASGTPLEGGKDDYSSHLNPKFDISPPLEDLSLSGGFALRIFPDPLSASLVAKPFPDRALEVMRCHWS